MSLQEHLANEIELQFYETAPHTCSYLQERESRSLVVTPVHLVTTEPYGHLVRQGFRRSGHYTYRPQCNPCHACIPVRIPVAQFKPNRTQRRVSKQHQHLTAREVPLALHDEHFELYQRYQSSRHTGGGMDQDTTEQYEQFLLQSQVDTRLIEFRDGAHLRMVSIIDCLADGLSSVYTFYDPDTPHASFGTYGILWQIDACQRIAREHLYLGYWIGQSQKMNYKRHYTPLQGLVDGQWRTLTEADYTELAQR